MRGDERRKGGQIACCLVRLGNDIDMTQRPMQRDKYANEQKEEKKGRESKTAFTGDRPTW
jgi:hypothetical protein